MKKLMQTLSLLLCAALLLAGCQGEGQSGDGETVLWYAGDLSDWENSTYEALAPVAYQGELTVAALMAALLAGPPEGSGLVSPFPQGTRYQYSRFDEETGILTVDLSQQYADLVGVELTLADYCITLTLAQLKGVYGVRITANGSELPYRDVQILGPQDVVFSGVEEEPVDISAALYFRREGSGVLGFELRIFQVTESDSPAQAVLEGLLAGPQDEGLVSVLPQGLELREVRVDDGVCYVDFSSVLLEQIPVDQDEQRLVIYSVVNTLCSLDTVEKVQLLVEGETLHEYGSVFVGEPLAANASRAS